MWYKEGTHIQIATVFTLTSSTREPYTGGTYITGAVGIDNSTKLVSTVNLFPNPASEILTIDISLTENQKVEVVLINSIGQKVDAPQIIDGTKGVNTKQLDIQKLPEGIYFAQILLNGNVVSTKQFVIAR